MEDNDKKPIIRSVKPAEEATIIPPPPVPKLRCVESKKHRDKSIILGAVIGLAIFAVASFAIVSYFTPGTPIRDWFARTTTSFQRRDSIRDGNASIFNHESIETVADSVMQVTVSVLVRAGIGSSYSGAGTGIVVSSDGYILTNKHVVEHARSVAIVHDGILHQDVTVVGVDPLNDVAFLKVNGVSGWEVATLGDSRQLRIGQPVIAVGYALGRFQNSVTAGIVSGVGRSVSATTSDGMSAENLTDMIQTDAAINSGNSGGPLANAGGQVIGINTAVSTGANGLGFAIPIGATRGMLRNLLATGRVERAIVGVRFTDVDASIVAEHDLPVRRGAFLNGENSVVPGGPADRAGVRPGDVITHVGGFEVGVHGNLATLLGEYTIGDRVELVVRRGSETLTKHITLIRY
ncbi:trypsin-like peptidase domain-containing protein [Candidatus Saccharibacteria bacterium]|nr:trypsin-like peptidase domain-containing protein [Candidatus Saccharibacteria bacterium]